MQKLDAMMEISLIVQLQVITLSVYLSRSTAALSKVIITISQRRTHSRSHIKVLWFI